MSALVEPMCCGEPMVSYCGGWYWECADAFFRLQDDGMIYDDGSSPPTLIEPIDYAVDLRRLPTEFHRELHAHLLATRIGPTDETDPGPSPAVLPEKEQR